MSDHQKDPVLLQRIFESSIEGILVVDDQGIILEANASCERMFGYHAGELGGLQLETLLPKRFEKEHRVHRKGYNKKPEIRAMGLGLDLWGLRKDGSEFPLDISLSPSDINGKSVTIAYVKDATKRKKDISLIEKSSAVASETSRKYGTLIANLQGIVYRCQNDRDWTMEYISEGCERITGYSQKDFLEGRVHFSHITFKEDQQKVWDDTQKGIQEKKLFLLNFRIRDKLGKVKYMQELGQGVYNEKGQLVALEGFITDVTEQKKAEEELRQKEAKNKALLEAIPDMMFIQDLKGNYLDFYAPEPERLLVPKKDFIGKNMKDVLPPEVNIAIKKAHKKVLESKTPQVIEYGLHVNGEHKIFEGRAVPLNQHALLTIVRDVTERKLAERELAESEAKIRNILEALPDITIINDKEGKILEMHTPDPDLLVASVDNLIGKNFKSVMPKNVGREIQKAFNRANRTKTIQFLEITLPAQSGPLGFEARIVPLENGKSLSILRDVTKTKLAQHDLFVRNRALEAAGNGITIVDARLMDCPIIYANKAFYSMTGYKNDEVLGRNCRFLQNDDRDQEAIIEMAKAIQKGELCQVELRNYKKDGTLFWNELTITPIHNDQEELTHFIGVQNDITERKKEEFLKDRIRQIMEMIARHTSLEDIGIAIVKTLEGNLKDCLASIFMLDRSKKTLHKLAASKLPKGFCDAIEGLAIGPKVGSCGRSAYLKKEVITIDISKDPHWAGYRDVALQHGLLSCWSSPIFSSNMEVLGTMAVYSTVAKEPDEDDRALVADLIRLTSVAIEQYNIILELDKGRWLLEDYAKELEQTVTERTNELKATLQKLVEANLKLKDQVQETKAAESRALASQEMFTAISKNFPKGVIIVFSPDFEFVYIDGGEIQRMGFDQGQFAGKHIDTINVFSKQRIARIKDDVRKTLTGEHLSFEIKFKNKDYAVNSSPLMGDDNEIKWALFVYNDITKQKQAETAVRNALNREQELNELKSRFISMASHEFRTPLSAIITAAILIEKQSAAAKADRLKKYTGQIQNNVQNLTVILNDFLSLSKLEEGKTKVKPEQFDLAAFAHDLANELKLNLKRGQHIALDTNAKVIDAYLDPKLMQHILTNLISNAIKYSEEDEKIRVALKKNEKSIMIAVKDRGIGIPEEEQANLFQRFFRAENSTNIQGTGLGLHIVKQHTELMGGKVGFESEKDKGSTFWVEFPVGNGGSHL